MWRVNVMSGSAPQVEVFVTTSWGQHDVGHCQSSRKGQSSTCRVSWMASGSPPRAVPRLNSVSP